MMVHLLRVITAYLCLVLCLLGLLWMHDGSSIALPLARAELGLTVKVRTGIVTFEGRMPASRALVRIAQLDPSQYGDFQEYELWSPSTCSTISLTEVLNAYAGIQRYRVADILKVQREVAAIRPD